jgi:hypothetical protein
MATKSIVLSPPITVSKNIPQPQTESSVRNYPDMGINNTLLESFIKKHKKVKSHNQNPVGTGRVGRKIVIGFFIAID